MATAPVLSTQITSMAREGGAALPITILLSTAAPTGGLAVNFQLLGSATPSDYTLAAGTGVSGLTTSSFVVAAGATQATLLVTANADLLGEATETLRLSLQPGAGYTVAPAGLTFAPAVTLPTAASDPHVVVGDFNGDRLLDIVGVNEDALKVTWLKGNGDGSFAVGVQVSLAAKPGDATVGDFNRDGISDLAVSLASTNQMAVALGSATGLSAWTNYTVGTSPRYSTVGDFNGDGLLDLAVSNLGKTVSVLLGKGNGTFDAAKSYASGDAPHQPVAIDVNLDGRQDVVLADMTGGKLLVHLADATGALGPATAYTVGTSPQGVTAGDFNRDSFIDVAVANRDSNSVSVLLGSGTGGFGTAISVTVGTGPTTLSAADVDGDGMLDLAVANRSGGTVQVLKGSGTGTFTSSGTFTLGSDPYGITTGDFDQDGIADVAVGARTGSEVTVGLSRVQPDVLSIVDAFRGTDGPDTLVGTSGPDSIVGLAGPDSLSGGDGNDTVLGGDGNDSLFGGNGVDSLNGGIGDDSIEGSFGGDVLRGGSGDDTLLGGTGNDRFYAGAGSDLIDGGEQRRVPWLVSLLDDNDVVDYSGTGGANLNLGSRTVTVSGEPGSDTYLGIEEIDGTANVADTVVGRLSQSAVEAAGGSAMYLYLRGGSDSVTQDAYGMQQSWADGVYIGYHWSTTPIQLSFSGAVATVSYGAEGSQLAGIDTLTNVSYIGDTAFNDTLNFASATGNHLGYVTDSRSGKSWHVALMGRGGSDTVVGNGQTTLNYGVVTTSSDGVAGAAIDLRSGSANLSGLSTNGVALGTLTFSGVRGLVGTKFNDSLIGGLAENDPYESFRGDGGDDLISGGSGYDRADYRSSPDGIVVDLAAGTVTSAGAGNDTLRGIESIRGSLFNDAINARNFTGGALSTTSNIGSHWWAWNEINPEGGNDTIEGNGATFLIYETSMVPVKVDLAAGIADARIDADKAGPQYLTLGRDVFSGVFGARGSHYDDLLLGGGPGRTTTGVNQSEWFGGGAGNDTIDGLAGWDAANYWNSPGAITVDLAAGTASDGWGSVDTLRNIEEILGTYFDDSLRGGSGNDLLSGLGGADSIDGGDGIDKIGFASTPDTWQALGVTVKLSGWVGTTGALPAGFAGSALDQHGSIDVFRNLEGVEGSNFADSISGDSGDNRLDGRGGSDTIDGGAGTDWAEYNQATRGVVVDLSIGKTLDDGQGQGSDNPSAAVERDTLISIENVEGGTGADSISGDSGANELLGNAGDDTLIGGADDDSLQGGVGNDSLVGGLGGDVVVYGGKQTDYTIQLVSGDQYTVTAKGNVQVQDRVNGLVTINEGVDRLSGVEVLRFADGDVQLTSFNPSPSFRTWLIGSSGEDRSDSIAFGPDGQILLGGLLAGPSFGASVVSAAGATASLSNSEFVASLGQDGSMNWIHPIREWDSRYALDLDVGNDGVVVGGSMTSAQSGFGAAVLRLANSGAVTGSVHVSGLLGTPDYGSPRVAWGVGGSAYVAALSGSDNRDVFLVKLSPEGTLDWKVTLDSGAQEWAIAGLDTGSNGVVYVAGSTYGDLGGSANHGVRDAFVTALNPQGQTLWTRLIGDFNYDDPVALAASPDGSVYVAGGTYTALGTATWKGATDGFVSRIGPDGTVLWSQTYGTPDYDTIVSVTPMPQGDVLAVMSTATLSAGAWTSSYSLMRIDGAGAVVWRQEFADPISDAAIGTDGRVYLTGVTTRGVDGQALVGAGDIFVTEIDFNPAPPQAPSGTDKAVTLTEDTPYLFSAGDFGFTDPNAGDVLSAVRIDALPPSAAGTLKLGSSAVAEGQVIEASQIGALKFEPTPDLSGSALGGFTFSVRDAALFDATPNTINLSISAVNDAPVNNVSPARVVVAAAETILPVMGVSDVDAGTGAFSVTLSASHGTLAVASRAGLTMTGNNTASVTLVGTLSDLNGLLGTGGALVYRRDAGYVGADSLTVQTSDASGSGAGGVLGDGDVIRLQSVVNGGQVLPAIGFAPAISIASGPGPNYANVGMVAGNFNGDAFADLAVINAREGADSQLGGTVSVFTGSASGLTKAGEYAAGQLGRSIAAGDINGDGKLDIVSGGLDGYVYVLKGLGNGAFDAAARFNASGRANSIATGDVNGDGRVDVVVGIPDAGSPAVLMLNDGSGGFGSATTILANNQHTLSLGDLDGDGRLDLITPDAGDATVVQVLYGNGDGSFGASVKVATTEKWAWNPVVADLNKDGIQDIVAPNYYSNSVTVIYGAGNRGFQSPIVLTDVASNPTTLQVADFNLDGNPDLAVVGSGAYAVLPGDGLGGFGDAIRATGAQWARYDLAVSDFNGDGRPDLAMEQTGAINQVLFAANNQAPSGTDKTISVKQSASYSLSASDFGFTDPDSGDTLGAVRVDSIAPSTLGALKLGTTIVTAGQVIEAQQIGTLRFEPASTVAVGATGTFSFSVRDASLFDPSPNALTFSIAAADWPLLPTVGNRMTGTDQAETIDGTAGDDLIFALRGNDKVWAASGNDFILGAEGDDGLFGGPGDDSLYGGAGNDEIQFWAEGGLDVAYYNGNRSDFRLDRTDGYGRTIVEDLRPGSPEGRDILTPDVEVLRFRDQDFQLNDLGYTVWGTAVAETLAGGSGSDGLYGEGGNDNVSGGASRDILDGGTGDDSIDGGDGYDSLWGRAGHDTMRGGAGVDSFDSGEGDDIEDGGDGDDTFLSGPGNDTVDGGAGNDLIFYSGSRSNYTIEAAGSQWRIADLRVNGSASGISVDGVDLVSGVETLRFSDQSLALAEKPEQAPSGTDKTIIATEDAPYAFTASDFGFTDPTPGDVLGAVRIDTLPQSSAGTLKLGSTVVTAGQLIQSSQIGTLIFQPAPNANGVSLGSLSFSVRDAALFDATPNTISFNVLPVNDRPTLDATKSPALTAVVPNAAAPANGSTVGATRVSQLIQQGGTLNNFADIDGDAAGIAITGLSNNASLYFSTNNGASWTMAAGVSPTTALVLHETDTNWIRFAPALGSSGSIADAVSFKAWDRTGGFTNGQTAVDASGGLPLLGSVGSVMARSLAVSGNLVFTAAHGTNVADANKIQIIDISNPNAPAIVGTYQTQSTANGIAVSGNRLYLTGDWDGLHIVDVTNPAAPVRLGGFNTAGNSYDVAVRGNYAYVADYAVGGLQIIDVSNPAAPVRAGGVDTPGEAKAIALDGNYAYLADAGLQIVDISNPAAPAIVGSVPSIGVCYDVVVRGGYAYVAGHAGGLRIVDVRSPAAPTLVGTYDTPGAAVSVSLVGNLAYVADQGGGVQVVDISDPVAPKLALSQPIPMAYDLMVKDSLMLVAAGPLQIYDANPSTAFSVQSDTASVQIAPSNQAPSGADKTISVKQNAPYAFSASDFGFSDPDSGDTLGAVRIDSMAPSTVGTLKLGTSNVAAGQVIDAAQIGTLRFEPAASATVGASGAFSFSVRDANLFDPSPNTVALNIAAPAQKIYGAVATQLAYSGDTPVMYEAWSQKSSTPFSRDTLIWNEGRQITDKVIIRMSDYTGSKIHFDVASGAALELAPFGVDVTGMISPWLGFTFLYEQTADGVTITQAWAGSYGGDLPTVVTVGGGAPYITEQMNSLPVGGLNIVGPPTVGSVLTLNDTITDAEGMGTKKIVWAVNGATPQVEASSYTVTAADVGKYISATVEYTDLEGNTQKVRSELVTGAASSLSVSLSGSITTDAGSSTSIAAGGATRDTTLGLSGTYAGTGVSRIDVYDGSTVLGSASLNAGIWTFTTPVLSSGSHTFRAVAVTTSVATATSETISATVDSVAPSVALSSNPLTIGAGQSATITAALSEASTDLALSDFAVAGGTLSNFSGSGSVYTATFTPVAGATTPGVVSLASGKFSDAVGNFNTDGNDPNNSVTVVVSSALPATGGHYYELVKQSVTWSTALSQAATASYRGLGGYLVVIDDAAENQFVKGFASGTPEPLIWIGISDEAQEGSWVVRAGPRAGQAATFFDWAPGEPSDSGSQGAENYAMFGWGVGEKWNDGSASIATPPSGTTFAYLIEYGGLPASYTITPSSSSVVEGSSVTFTIDTKNVEWGSSISYTLSGITQPDLSSGSMGGTATVNQNGLDGRATVTLGLAADQAIEGIESLVLVVGNTQSAPVSVLDPAGGNRAPSGTDKTISLVKDSPYVFSLADFGFTDPDGGDTLGAVRIDSLPAFAAGTLRLGAVPIDAGRVLSATELPGLMFQPLANATGSPLGSFTFSVRDASLFDLAPNTITINVTTSGGGTVNVAPAGTDKSVVMAEDAAYAFSAFDFGFTDPNPGDVLGAVRIDALPAATAGTLKLGTLPVATAQVIDAAQIGSLRFEPAANAFGPLLASFQFSVRDASLFDPSPNTITLNVTPVNDLPTGTLRMLSQVAAPAVTRPYQSSDITNSTAQAFNPTTGHVYEIVSANLTWSQANMAASVRTLGGAPGHLATLGDYAELFWVFSMGGGYGGTGLSPESWVGLSDAEVEGSWKWAAGPESGASATWEVRENAASADYVALSDAAIFNARSATQVLPKYIVEYSGPVVVTPAKAAVEATTGAHFTEGAVLYADAGLIADADGVGTFSYRWQRLSSTASPAVPTSTTTTASTSTNDPSSLGWSDIPGATGAGYTLTNADAGRVVRAAISYADKFGTTETVYSAPSPVIANLNDPPAGTDKVLSIQEDSVYTFSAADFGFNDPDAGDQFGAVRIDSLPQPAAGVLKLGTSVVAAGAVIPATAIGTLSFTPSQNANGLALGGFSFSVRDAELFDPSPNALTFSVVAVNDPPVNTVPPSVTARVGSSTTISGLSFTDPDTEGQNISVTLGAQQGTVSIIGFPPSVVVAGNGTASLKLTGSIADLKLALATGISYRGNQTGSDTLTMFSTDFGYSGAGGTQTDLDTISVTVLPAAVNQPPGGTVTISGAIRQAMPLTVSQNLADPDGIPAGAIGYQWFAAGVPIAGATGTTFSPASEQVGKSLSVVARYTDSMGNAESVSSQATAEVAPALTIGQTVETWDSGVFKVYGRSGDLPLAGFIKRGERGDVFIANGNAQIINSPSGVDGKYFELVTGDTGTRLRFRSDSNLQGGQDQRAFDYYTDGRERIYSVAGDDVYVATVYFADKGWSSTLAFQVVDTLPAVYLSGNPTETVTLHDGSPLTGSITGSKGKDAYTGTATNGQQAAISQASIVDLFGDSEINATVTGGWSPVGVDQSNIKLGDGYQRIVVTVNAAGSASAVSSSTIELGAGDSLVNVTLGNGNTGDDRYLSAVQYSTYKAGGGNDRIEVVASDSTPNDGTENFVRALHQVSSSGGGGLDMGDGNDEVILKASNADRRAATAAETSLIVLGAGQDKLNVESTLVGLDRSSVEGGAGNDQIVIDAFLVGAKSSQISAGDGDDTVVFKGGGDYSVSIDASDVSLGAGNDRLELERGIGSIDGGAGNDVLKLSGKSTEYLFTQPGVGKVTIRNVLDGRVDLSVSNVETFEFADRTLTQAEALSQLGQTVLPPATDTAKVHEGQALTGYISGSTGNDTYVGEGRTGVLAAITRASITDPLGNNAVQASIRGGWSPSGIELSTIKFGDGVSSIDVEAVSNGSLSGISGSTVDFGAGAGRIAVMIDTGATSDGRNMRAIDSSIVRMGAGVDVLEVMASDDSINDGIENYIRGVNNSALIDLGDGNDQVRINVSNAGARAATAVERSGLFLGNGDDRVDLSSSLTGLDTATVDGGAGNDVFVFAADQVALKGSELALGAGNDVVSVAPGGERSVSLDASNVSLGTGDDRIEIDRGNGTIDGGMGTDTLKLSGPSTVYRVAQISIGRLSIRDVTDGRTDLQVSGIENLQFSDRTVTTSQALIDLAQTPFPTLANTTKLHEGSPLTGYINGSSGHDQYSGVNPSAGLTAITRAVMTDSLGDSVVNAVTRGGWSASGIEHSSIRFGDGLQKIAVEVVSNGSTSGILNTQIEFGAGDSLIQVAVDTGTTSDNRSMRGLDAVVWRAGAGSDVLEVRVSDGTVNDGGENFVRGLLNVSADLGEGADRIAIDVSNAAAREASAVEGGTITLGAGDDELSVQSTRLGIVRAVFDAGDGNDVLSVSAQTALTDTQLSLGAGNDPLLLAAGGSDSTSLDGSTVDLGSGDDLISLVQGRGTIDGGAGIDVLKVAGEASLFAIEQTGTDRQTLRSIAGAQTSLSLLNIERVEFSDGVVVLKEVVAPTPTYSLSASNASVNEGGTVTFNLVATNVAADTQIPWAISGTGITSVDLKGQPLSGSFAVNSLGRASLTLPISDDLTTEGIESLTLTAAGKSAVVTIQDTSTTPVAVAAAVNFSNLSGLRTSESGDTASYGVVLSKAPRYDVKLTLTISDSTEGVFEGGGSGVRELTFTPSNWNQVQTVTVKGVDDGQTDGDISFAVSTQTASDDLEYDGARAGQGLVVSNVQIINTDDDIPDQQLGTSGVDYLQGGAGPSDMYGFLGRDELKGGRGDDRLYGGYDDDRLIGEDGNDSLEGEQGSDVLHGNAGDDNLLGGTGKDSLYGGDGNDTLDGDKDADYMDGGNGSDTYYLDNPLDVVEDTGTDKARDVLYIATYLSRPLVLGKGIDDAELSEQAAGSGLTGNDSDNGLKGNSANNALDGGAGADDLSGGAGSDSLLGGAGNDELRGGEGSDTLNGGEGVDCAEYEDQMIGIFASLIEAVAKGRGPEEGMWTDKLLYIEDVCGSQGDDQIKGDAGSNKIGGNGGKDTLAGGAGFDWLEPDAALNGLKVDLSQGKVLDDGFGGTDTVSGIEGVIGTGYADAVMGDARLNRFWGQGGDDTIDGGLGGDEAWYSGAKADYRIESLGAGKVKVSDLRAGAPDGVDQLSNVETLVFSDTSVEVGGADPGYATLTQAQGSSGGKLSGVVYHWKSHALLDGVQFAGTAATGASGGGGSATGSAITQLFELKAVKSAAAGKLSAELWVNPKIASGSVDVTLKFDPSLNLSYTDAGKLPSGWTSLDSSKTGQWTLAGMGLSAFNAPVQLGVVEWSSPGALSSVAVNVADAATEGETQRPYSTTLAVGMSASDGSPTDTSGATGAYSISSLALGTNAVTATKAIGASESGSVVGGADAIATLKISLGMNPNLDGRPLSPYQLIAADVNEDGRVNAADALAVLKMAVGRADAPQREWLFVKESEDFWDHTANGGAGGWTVNARSVAYDRGEKAVSVGGQGELNLVGVLKGDVNGSWQSTQDAPQELPDTYFRDLSLELNAPVGQWGIGG